MRGELKVAKSLKEYAKDYKAFYRPVYEILVNDKEIEGETLEVEEIKATINSTYEASVCNIKIVSYGSKYESENLTIDSNLTNIKEGAHIEVKLGYMVDKSKKLKPVFLGYIMSLRVEYSGKENIVYNIEAMDAKAVMMNNCLSYDHMGAGESNPIKYSEIARSILDKYKDEDFCKPREISETLDVKAPVVQEKKSVYDFMVEIAKKANCLFYVVNGNVYFKNYPDANEGNCDVIVNVGRYLSSFSREVSLNKKFYSVKVWGNSAQEINGEKNLGQLTAIGDGARVGTETYPNILKSVEGDLGGAIKTENMPELISKEEAEKRAEAELMANSLKYVTGDFEMVGLPDIEPGKYVKIDKLNDDFNKYYFLTQVEHVFNRGGYKTKCKFGANVL